MFTNHNDQSEAVLFFSRSFVVKEMLMAEFDAVLDGVVELSEFAGQDCQAVYVKIDPYLQITAAVFFTIAFDAQGQADRGWNLPLKHMAEIAGFGPDLGAGPIRLACRSQCPVPWHQQKTWDPILKPEANSFTQLRQSVLNNRLGLIAQAPVAPAQAPASPHPQPLAPHTSEQDLQPNESHWQMPTGISEADIPVLTPEQGSPVSNKPAPVQPEPGAKPESDSRFAQAERDKAASIIKQLRLRLQMQANEHQDEISRLQQHEAGQQENLQHQLKQAQQLFELEQTKNQQLKSFMSEQAADFQLAREQFMERMEETRQLGSEQIDSLKEKFEQELKASLDKETSQLKEMLDMREVELFYREEQISNLREEISQQRQQMQAVSEEGTEQLLERMKNAGITFVAFHPGVGHISIPADDISHYLQSPTAYAAEKAFVEEAHYLRWMKHFYNPVCTAHVDNDEPCLHTVERIDKPADFQVGKHDRCQAHQAGKKGDFNVVSIGS